MSTRNTTILVLILIVVAVVVGTFLWNQFPNPMASHWNVNDQVNGYMPRFWGVYLMPLVALVMLVLFLVIPAIDPLKANIAKFRGIFNLFIVLIIAFLMYVHGISLAWNLGYHNLKIGPALLPFLGILFIFIGFMMRQAKRNFFIGIRTPWTLSSDTVWDKTHQLGSILFMISGAIAFIGAFFGGMIAMLFLLIPLVVSTLFLLVYSFVLYQQESKS